MRRMARTLCKYGEEKETMPPQQTTQELSTKRQDLRIIVDCCSKANFRSRDFKIKIQ